LYRKGRIEAIPVQANDETVFIVIITVLATLVVGGLTLVAYLWYLTPGPEQIR
jgi:NhaP-type Na+/H+ or K+/H+ antiporter